MFDMWTGRAAETARKHQVRLEAWRADKLASIDAKRAIVNRKFKCGPWRWVIEPKHKGLRGQMLSPEIIATRLLTHRS